MAFQFPPEVEAADEAFWRKQEGRKRGLLGQPCCTQSKMSWALMNMPGDLAVIIHGEFDCLNCFHHHLGANAHNFFSTRLSDHQMTVGQTQPPLEHLIRLLVAERKPQAIVVLGTCPVEVIGDRFEVVTERLAEELGTPILAMHTSGLAMSSMTDCQDWLFESLASLPQHGALDHVWYARAEDLAMDVVLGDDRPTVTRSHELHARIAALAAPVEPDPARRLNLLGLPGLAREPVEVLAALGLQVNGFFPHGASLDHWQSIARASTTFAVDRTVYPRLVKRLRALGQEVHDVRLPIGLAATEAFYREIAARFGAEGALEEAIGPRLVTARAAVEAFRSEHGGLKLGMAMRMLNTYQVDRLVQDGLGDVDHLRELGFDVHLFIQGPPEEGPKFEERLRERGVNLPVQAFPGPWVLAEFLQRAGCAVCHVPDSSRNLVRRAGIPMISSRALQPWLSGIEQNLGVLTDLVGQGRAPGGTR
jgi:hypothetical protein